MSESLTSFPDLGIVKVSDKETENDEDGFVERLAKVPRFNPLVQSSIQPKTFSIFQDKHLNTEYPDPYEKVALNFQIFLRHSTIKLLQDQKSMDADMLSIDSTITKIMSELVSGVNKTLGMLEKVGKTLSLMQHTLPLQKKLNSKKYPHLAKYLSIN
ncbi:hypothetical protein HDV06_006865 [Boothiomyces sp. JEL0866]|nr:hypothetical protein HDV06_006865 [Boothiomyces sp. JEL0866]